jgi:hypothetical protein
LPRPGASGRPHLLAGDRIEPGPLPDDFYLLADQTTRTRAAVELPGAAALGPENETQWPLFEPAAQVQIGVHWHAAPFQ